MQSFRAVITCFVLVILSLALISGPGFAADPTVEESFGTVVFFKHQPFVSNAIYLTIADEKFTIKNKESLTVTFPVGEHRISFSAESDWPEIPGFKRFIVRAGETTYFQFSAIKMTSAFFAEIDKVAESKFPQGLRRLGSFAFNQKANDSIVRKAVAPPVTVAQSAVAPTIKPSRVSPIKANRHAIAVIIGNQTYTDKSKDIPNVDYAHNDADAIFQYVTEALGYRESNIIYLKDATQADLVSTFGNDRTPKGKLFSWVRPNESDVFVFYSGHGAPGLPNGQGYLLPIDTDPMAVELNGYPLETLYANLAQVPAKSMTLVIDACFSGSSANGAVVRNASSIALRHVDTTTKIPNAVVLTAADVSEVASWDEKARHGLFTEHFLQGVSGKADRGDFGNADGQVTLGELKSYLESEVTYMARRLYMRDQHPGVTGDSSRVLSVLSSGG